MSVIFMCNRRQLNCLCNTLLWIIRQKTFNMVKLHITGLSWGNQCSQRISDAGSVSIIYVMTCLNFILCVFYALKSRHVIHVIYDFHSDTTWLLATSFNLLLDSLHMWRQFYNLFSEWFVAYLVSTYYLNQCQFPVSSTFEIYFSGI